MKKLLPVFLVLILSLAAFFSGCFETATITWKYYDGSILKTEDVFIGFTPSYNGAAPTRPEDSQFEYVFVGWTPKVVEVSGDAVYTTYFGVSAIKNDAFKYQSGLSSYTIQNTVKSIGSFAFYGTGLTSVSIPNGVTTIGNGAFLNCRKLTSLSLPESVVGIGADAFGITAITTVTIPAGVTRIENNTFNNCANLTTVTVPAGVNSIGERSFFNCTALRTINFGGTTAQWNGIAKGADWNLSVPATRVVCSNGNVSL